MPFLQTEFNEYQARFSPDGRRVAYTSNESGRDEIYVREFSPDSPARGGKWMVSQGGGHDAHWRGLLYFDPSGKVMAVEVSANAAFQAGAPKALFQVPAGVTQADVTADGKRFLFAVPEDGQGMPAPLTAVMNWTVGLKK